MNGKMEKTFCLHQDPTSYTAQHPERQPYSKSLPCEPEISHSLHCFGKIRVSTNLTGLVMCRFNRKNIVVRLLEHARGISNETETIDRRVQRVVIHSRYDYTTFNNDIALLSLDRDVALEGRLRPACLPALGRLTFSISVDINYNIDISTKL